MVHSVTGAMEIWFVIFSVCMLTISFYFTLTYFEYLKHGDNRLIKQTKFFAVLSLFLALGVPAFYLL